MCLIAYTLSIYENVLAIQNKGIRELSDPLQLFIDEIDNIRRRCWYRLDLRVHCWSKLFGTSKKFSGNLFSSIFKYCNTPAVNLQCVICRVERTDLFYFRDLW